MIGKTKFANIPEVLQKYRDYDNNTSKIQASKMREATLKIRKQLINQYPELNTQSSLVKIKKIFGIPVFKRKYKGCNFKDKYCNIIRIAGQEPIFTYDATNLPIYIINFNRLSYLKQIIAMLEKYGLYNIHIIDNLSTYPPMVEYLQKTPYTVHYMKKNYGHMVFFSADEFKQVRENEYYVLTDPDVIAIDECPNDFMDYFYYLLQKYPKFNKVGFSLKTDDITGSAEAKELLIRWERLFYKHHLNHIPPYLYSSSIDTTFAMYRPQKQWKTNDFYKAIRTGSPYEARHLPWYKDLHNLNDEDKFYISRDCGSGNWNNLAGLANIRENLLSKTVEHWWEYLFSIKKSCRRTIVRILGIKFSHNREMPGD